MKAFKFKLYASKHNRKLSRRIEVAACIYNHCIALHKRYYRLFGRHLSENVLKKHLTNLKKQPRFHFWNELGSQAVQDVVERIERGYKLFFENRKRHVKSAPPSFKKRSRYHSFTLKQAGYKYDGANRVKIGKKTFRFFKSREIEGKIKTLTVKRDAVGDFYVIFVCESEAGSGFVTRTGKSVGYDFGLKRFLTASDGNDVISPLFLHENMRKIQIAGRALSTKQRGSNNRRRARLVLARLYHHVAAARDDFHWKLALELVRKYDIICLEDLNMKALQKRFGKKIGDLGFADFVIKLKRQAKKHGTLIVSADRFFASSQTCSKCGRKNVDVRDLRVRQWTCPECGTVHDRDRNAAFNIHAEGLQILRGQDIVLQEESLSDDRYAA